MDGIPQTKDRTTDSKLLPQHSKELFIALQNQKCSHTAKKVFNFFQTLFNHIQGCVGCQMKQKTSMNMNLVVFCAKTQLELKKSTKMWKRH